MEPEESGTYVKNPESGPVIKEGSYNFKPYTDKEYVLKNCDGDVPDSKVTYTPWVDENWNCGDTTTTQTRTKTVTPYVWDIEEREWDEGTPVVTTETGTRALTKDEQYACPIPVKPAATGVPDDCDGDIFGSITVTPVEGVTYFIGEQEITGTVTSNGISVVAAVLDEGYVLDEGAVDEWTFESNPATDCVRAPETTYTEWVDGSYNCDDTTVVQTRTNAVTTYTWNVQTQSFVGSTVTTTETRTRDLTPVEIRACPPGDAPVPALFALRRRLRRATPHGRLTSGGRSRTSPSRSARPSPGPARTR